MQSYNLKSDLFLKLICDKCGHEFDLEDFPEEDFKCPGCGDDECTFSLAD